MSKTQQITRLALFTALAYIAAIISKIMPSVSGFLSYDPKDIVLTIAGFAFGPLAAALVALAVSLLELITISDTGVIGFIMNLLSSCGFACVAAVIYKKSHTINGAVLGLVAGCFSMTALMLLWNYFLTPWYMGIPREAVAAMLLPIFLPFNLFKSAVNAGFVLLLYKPIRRVLVGVGLLKTKETSGNVKGMAITSMIVFFVVSIAIVVFIFPELLPFVN